MKKTFAILILGASLTSISMAQTAVFNFNSAADASQDTFTSNGVSLTVNGLASSTSLNQNLSSLTLNATATNILVGPENGIGTGPFSDDELRNGAGTPALSGATVLELSHITTPKGTMATSLDINMTSVDKATNEGFLVYGSTQDASKGAATLTLLDHGFGNNSDDGSFAISSSMLSKYSSFYVTADNGYYSSVLLGNGTSICTSVATPEPMSVAGLALGGLVLLRRRKKA